MKILVDSFYFEVRTKLIFIQEKTIDQLKEENKRLKLELARLQAPAGHLALIKNIATGASNRKGGLS